MTSKGYIFEYVEAGQFIRAVLPKFFNAHSGVYRMYAVFIMATMIRDGFSIVDSFSHLATLDF
jgi:hypothetical protein